MNLDNGVNVAKGAPRVSAESEAIKEIVEKGGFQENVAVNPAMKMSLIAMEG